MGLEALWRKIQTSPSQVQIVAINRFFHNDSLWHSSWSKKGYTLTKKGRPSHHLLMAFIADVKIVANMWLRGGNTSSATNFLGFLEDTLSKLKNKTVSLIRLDSGFFQSDISFPETSPEEDL